MGGIRGEGLGVATGDVQNASQGHWLSLAKEVPVWASFLADSVQSERG